MKRSVIIFFTFIFVFGFVIWKQDISKKPAAKTVVYPKKEMSTIFPATIVKHETAAPTISQPERNVASVPSLSNIKTEPAERKLIGDVESVSGNIQKLQMLNNIDPRWEENLYQDLFRVQDPQTKLEIKKVSSVIEVKNGQGLYRDIVEVSYLLSTGEKSSFTAKVDPASAKILQTWNYTRFEQNPLNKMRFTFQELKTPEL